VARLDNDHLIFAYTYNNINKSWVIQDTLAYEDYEKKQELIHNAAEEKRNKIKGLCVYLWDEDPLCNDVFEKEETGSVSNEVIPIDAPVFSLVDDGNRWKNLTNKKPRGRWRLNTNWVSQRPYYLHWWTVEDRAKDMLSQAGNPDTVWEDIKKISEVRDLKPEFMVCLYYQENSLHGSSKGGNNYLNNWNNDRWDTVSYKKAIHWRNQAAQTLNNKYLWAYTKTRQLYGSTNPEWPNYTTEWNNTTKRYSWNGVVNLHNCLWMIYWNKNVSWQFEFRTTDFSYLTEYL